MMNQCYQCLNHGYIFAYSFNHNTHKIIKCNQCNQFDSDSEATEYALNNDIARLP